MDQVRDVSVNLTIQGVLAIQRVRANVEFSEAIFRTVWLNS